MRPHRPLLGGGNLFLKLQYNPEKNIGAVPSWAPLTESLNTQWHKWRWKWFPLLFLFCQEYGLSYLLKKICWPKYRNSNETQMMVPINELTYFGAWTVFSAERMILLFGITIYVVSGSKQGCTRFRHKEKGEHAPDSSNYDKRRRKDSHQNGKYKTRKKTGTAIKGGEKNEVIFCKLLAIQMSRTPHITAFSWGAFVVLGLFWFL